MLDPKFNPYDLITELQGQVVKCLDNQQKLARNNQQTNELQTQIIDNLNQVIAAVNAHDLQLQNLHDRLVLLEVARQYDNSKNTEQS